MYIASAAHTSRSPNAGLMLKNVEKKILKIYIYISVIFILVTTKLQAVIFVSIYMLYTIGMEAVANKGDIFIRQKMLASTFKVYKM